MHRKLDDTQDEDEEENLDWPEGAVPRPGPTALNAEAGFPEEFDREAFWGFLCDRFGRDIVTEYILQLGLPDNERKVAQDVINNFSEQTSKDLLSGKGLETNRQMGLSRNIPAAPQPMPLHIGIDEKGPLSQAPSPPKLQARPEDLPLQIIADLRDRSWKKRENLQ